MGTHLIKMMSTAWRKRSHVLYSSGSSCTGEVNLRQHVGHRNQRTHIKGVVLSHLAHELLANPSTNQRSTFLIEPSKFMYSPDNPLALALFGQHVTQASIVRGPPKCKIEKEEDFAGCGW